MLKMWKIQKLNKDQENDSREIIGRTMHLSKIGSLKISLEDKSKCYLVPTQSGWLLHMPLAKAAKGV
jgi:hypothetical protein